MRYISLDKLETELAKPGFEKELLPLVMYRGRLTLGDVHRRWNMVVAMMMHEVESVSEAIHHFHADPQWSKLCYPERSPQAVSMYTFLSRMADNPKLSGMVPALTEYVDWILPSYRRFHLTRVERQSTSRRNLGAGGWRTYSGRVHSDLLEYPFLIHAGGGQEHELLKAVTAAIPTGIPGSVRADMCQDLVVGILSGEFDRDDLHLPAKEVMKRVRQMFPTKYAPDSLDAPRFSDAKRSLHDTLADEERDWA